MTSPTTPRRKPARTTVDLCAYVRPEVKQRAEDDARRHAISVSEYVSALIRGQSPPERPAAGLTDVALAGHRVVVALDAARERGEPASIALLTELRAEIVRALLMLRPLYDAQVDAQAARRADDWSGH